jgi:hypothetical protein
LEFHPIASRTPWLLNVRWAVLMRDVAGIIVPSHSACC